MSKAVYVGVNTSIPIHEMTTVTETFALNTTNIDTFFVVTNGSGTSGWTLTDNPSAGVNLAPGNIGVDNSTATITLKAVRDLSGVVIRGAYYTETNFDKITLTVAGIKVLNAVSGGSASALRYSGSIAAGKEIVLKYVKDVSNSATNEANTLFAITCDDLTISTEVDTIVGYEQKDVARKVKRLYVGVGGVARKVKRGYVGVDGVARQFFTADVFVYTGEYSETDVTKDDAAYKLYTLTTSGTLTLGVDAQVWACGGGAGGGNATSSGSGGGGGGGYVLPATGVSEGMYAVIIGAGGAAGKNGSITSIGDLSANGGNTMTTIPNGGSGGSGGGGGGNSTSSAYRTGAGGKGAGVSTYPFDLTDLKAHSAGGGAGHDNYQYTNDEGTSTSRPVAPGNGGTNGGSGNRGEAGYSTTQDGLGGDYGGGKGGGSSSAGRAATFYGAGGGGGGRSTSRYTTGGSGYQGVVYVLIPA